MTVEYTVQRKSVQTIVIDVLYSCTNIIYLSTVYTYTYCTAAVQCTDVGSHFDIYKRVYILHLSLKQCQKDPKEDYLINLLF